MRKFILIIALLISGVGLNAQSVGSSSIVYYDGYSLKFTVTKLDPAECKVVCDTKPTTPVAVSIPSSVTIEGSTFSVTSIGNRAFYYCDGMTSIEIPNSVTSIGDWAFSSCFGLTSIEIPNSVTSIGKEAFSLCYGLESFVVEGGNPNYDSRNNCNAIIETQTNTLLYGCMNTIIPNSVTSIGERAFYYCSGLTSIEIPNSVTSIGNEAFSYCDYMTSIEIPNSVTSIGEGAFFSCSGLTSIEIPNSVTSIGNYAFSWNLHLRSIKCHAVDVPVTATYAFYYCPEDMTIQVPEGSVALYQAAQPWSNYNVTKMYPYQSGDYVVVDYEGYSLRYTIINVEPAECEVICETKPTTEISITIPSSVEIEGVVCNVTKIGNEAFYSCDYLTSIEIPNSVTSIGDKAFYECSNLTSIEIPNSVTSIGDYVFAWCSSITSLAVADGNTIYDSRDNCNAIIETSSNTLIAGCQNTVIPNSITVIGVGAFGGRSNMTSIEIPNSVTSIEMHAFGGCLGMENIEIPNSVNEIEMWAFWSCSSLASIEIPNSVTSIGNLVFEDCSSLTSIFVADGNTVYDSRENCNAIIETSSNTLIAGCQNTVIPNSVTKIGYGAFRRCSNLTSIEIPNSVTEIGMLAWDGCSSLTSIICHAENVPETGSPVFDNCPSDMIIYVPINSVALYQATEPWNNYNIVAIPEIGDNSIIDYEGYSLQFTITSVEPAECEVICSTKPTEPTAITIPYSAEISGIECSVTSIGDHAFYYCSSLTSIEIPNSVTSIGNWAFYGCSSLTSVEIPNSITSIGRAFAECSSLISIVVAEGNTVYDSRENCNAIIETSSNTLIVGCQNTVIPNSVTSIGDHAFYYCSSLTSIEIPNSVTSIGNGAFYGCSSLTSVEIPNSVTSIGRAFAVCSSLISIVVAEGNTVYDSRENCNAIIETSSNTLIVGCQNTVIPNSVTSIGYDAFNGRSSLTSIEIPNSVTSIGDCAFYSCSSLTSIEIPNSVTSIGNWAFYYCESLTSIEIPNSVTSIGGCAFYGCSSLTSIEIPNSVTSIGVNAFSGCSSLTSVVVAEGNTVYDSRENCNAIIETYSNTLIVGCQNTVIPNSVTSIGNSAFYSCTNLTSIEIPNNVTSIGDSAFSECYSLTSIEIPNSVSSIGNSAFSSCYSLTNIECHASEVPVTGSSVFYNCPSDMTIMVPSVALEDYQAAEPWNNYNLITGLEFEVDVLKNIEEAGIISGTGTYTDGETVTITAVPNEGYKFVYWSHNGTVLSADAEYSFTVTSDMVIKANFLTPNHWTPDPTIYPNNMTIIADVKIDGRDLLQRNIIFKLYDSYGDGWNGCSLTVEFSDGTPSQNLTFYSGRSAVHTLKVYSGTSIINVSFNQGSWPEECSFTIEYEDGELIYQSSGTPNAGHVCEFKTLGYSPSNIELGAFCGEELRGTSRSQYIESPVDGFEFFLLLYGNDSDEITFKLYDHETDSVLDLVTQERIDFEANGTIGIMSNPNIINFTSRVSVTTEAEIAEAGTVTGGGMYHIGETITLTATSNEGFVFKNWTLNDEVVSEESEYTFVVASEAEYKANYHYRQERQLTKGWNWYSTYVNNEGPEGLYAMEDELGSVGRQIKSQNDFVSYEDGSWYGTLSEVSNDEMYMIKLSRAKKFEMIGEKVDLSECPITLGNNWKWISYPLKRPMNVGMAFSGITPNTGDYIKSQTGFAQYDEELGWRGTLNSMMPGEGYMYYNTSGYAKTLVYPEANAKTEIEDNITSDYNHWIADMTMYPANMNIIATVDNNSGNNFEVAAFCDGECRGSARPIYIEELNAKIIFLTVCGDNNETISFRYYDIDSEKEYDIVNTLTFGMNDITGSMREPYIMSFIPADVDEVSLSGINIYPNPADINDEINLGAECERVEIYNSLGVKVSEYENVNHIDGIETAGIYVIKIINKGTIKYDRIIVR